MDTKIIYCPLMETEVEEYQCYLICEAAEGNLPENEMPQRKKYAIESNICNSCKYHSID